ncbi:unnamed protein product [Mytilus edulis]|uniref:Uncharacterized protein n=1 Tax=Mytilus edulis TaxID=6550 RepID=A0A8S3S142_MYTED|nr:unnamed protein product [Mytilus edulis]
MTHQLFIQHGGTFVIMFDGRRDFHEPLEEYPTGDISNEWTISLVYRLQQSSIPSALSFKLIGAISGIWPIKELNDCPLLYHCSAVLCVDGQTELRIIVEDKRVIIYLTHELSKHFISPNIAASIQECLTLTLEAVLTFYLSSIGKSYRKMNVSNLFQIEIGEICDRSPCVVSISKAVNASNWVCDKGINHDTKCSRLWFFDKGQKECQSNCTGLDKTVLTKSPTDKHLARLAKQLSINKCKELVLYLGIEETEWEEIEYVYLKAAFDYEIHGIEGTAFQII